VPKHQIHGFQGISETGIAQQPPTRSICRDRPSSASINRFVYDRQVFVAIAEELDPNRWKAALASDRHRRIAALIHRWLSATLLDRLGILAVDRGCIRNHHIADGGVATIVYCGFRDPARE
jgi:hypothetical protein